jgi:hypothetical protein
MTFIWFFDFEFQIWILVKCLKYFRLAYDSILLIPFDAVYFSNFYDMNPSCI